MKSDVAAVIIEPVVGTNGVLIPPKEYLPRLREICNRHEVLLIADEVMTGWCRTGKWFAVDHLGCRAGHSDDCERNHECGDSPGPLCYLGEDRELLR